MESGEGKIHFILEDAKTSDKSVQFPVQTANDWKKFNIPFASKGSYAPGDAHIIFRLGYRRRTVEIADLEILDYGTSRTVDALPMSKPDLSYPGMEPDAPRHAAADERIKRCCKSTLTVEVVDAAGQLTPAGQMYRDLVFHQWWTHEDTTTAKGGSTHVEGFLGRYEVTVSHGEEEIVQQTEIAPGGTTLKIFPGGR